MILLINKYKFNKKIELIKHLTRECLNINYMYLMFGVEFCFFHKIMQIIFFG